MSALALFRRDVALAVRQGGGAVIGLGFFVLAIVLIPLGVGREGAVLMRIAPGVIWIAALLATLLSLDRLFQADFEDGSLDQLVLAPLPLELTVLVKAAAHWLTTGLPMVAAAPLLGLMLQMPAGALTPLVAALAAGTPALSLIGAIGAGITVGVRRGGLLLSVLVLPLYVPTLILGARVAELGLLGLPWTSTLLLVLALTLLSGAVAPFAAAAALRVNLR